MGEFDGIKVIQGCLTLTWDILLAIFCTCLVGHERSTVYSGEYVRKVCVRFSYQDEP